MNLMKKNCFTLPRKIFSFHMDRIPKEGHSVLIKMSSQQMQKNEVSPKFRKRTHTHTETHTPFLFSCFFAICITKYKKVEINERSFYLTIY